MGVACSHPSPSELAGTLTVSYSSPSSAASAGAGVTAAGSVGVCSCGVVSTGDTGNNSEASTWRAAVESADQLVLTTSVKEDASAKIASLADKLDNEGFADKLANAVTLVHHTSTRGYPELEQRIVEHMGARTRALVTLPFEAALDEGGTIEWDKLSDQSHEAWLAATAAVIDGLR